MILWPATQFFCTTVYEYYLYVFGNSCNSIVFEEKSCSVAEIVKLAVVLQKDQEARCA